MTITVTLTARTEVEIQQAITDFTANNSKRIEVEQVTVQQDTDGDWVATINCEEILS